MNNQIKKKGYNLTKNIKLKIAFKKILKKSDLIEKSIGKVTKSNYSHCELIINNIWVSSNYKNGVTIIEDKVIDNNEWDIYEFPIIQIMERDYKIILDFIKKQDDKRYDFLGIILSQLIPFSIHNRKKYFCSEISVKVLQLFLIEEVIDLIPNNTSPGDLAKIFKMEN